MEKEKMKTYEITLSGVNTLLTIIVKASIALLLISMNFIHNDGIVLSVDTNLSGDIVT